MTISLKSVKNGIILLFLVLVSCQPAFARDFKFTLSTNALYANINDPRFEYKDEYQILKQFQIFTKSISTGIAFSPLDDKRFSVNIATNRFTNWKIDRKLHDKQTNLDYDYRTKTTLDSIYFGYRFGRVLPQLIIANMELQKKLYFANSLVKKDYEHTVLFGASLGYFLTKNLLVSSFIIAPNKALHLEVGAGVGATLIF